MVSRLHDCLVKLFWLTLGVAILLQLMFGLVFMFCFERSETLGCTLCSLVAAAIGLILHFRGRSRRKSSYRHWLRYTGKLFSNHRILSRLVFVVPLMSCLALVLVILMMFNVSLYRVGVSAGIALAEVGAFEFSERIFSATPFPDGSRGSLSLTGTWDADSTRAFNSIREARVNAVISKVYGSDSAELAHRYQVLGEKYRASATRLYLDGEKEAMKRYYVASSEWYRDAATLYLRQMDLGSYSEALSNVAYCENKLGHGEAALRAYRESKKYVFYCSIADRKSICDRLGIVACQNGLAEEGEALWSKANSIIVPEKKSESCADYTLLLFVISVGCLRGLFLLYLNIESSIAARAERRIKDELKRLRFLDMMVDLELARGDFEKADSYSIRCLRMAEEI